MATYSVKYNQNIYDIATLLYGSVEGVFDLLISNPTIDMDTDLAIGTELTYHESYMMNEDIAQTLEDQSIIPATGERSVYPVSLTGLTMKGIALLTATPKTLTVTLNGSGRHVIDWGDGSTPTEATLTGSAQFTHSFGDGQSTQTVRIYGVDGLTTALTASGSTGHLYYTDSINGVVNDFDIA